MMRAVADLPVQIDLRQAQDRVRQVVAQLPLGHYWDRPLTQGANAALSAQGHFPQYRHELTWTARAVVGHLRDSARIFTDRIHSIQAGSDPELVDFVTDEPERLAGYHAIQLPVLLAELEVAQQQLAQAAATVRCDQLGLRGRHLVDGPVTVAQLLDFLPRHQCDHADQLESLLAAARSCGMADAELAPFPHLD